MDVPDEVIDDCYVSFFDLPKALIRDCIYDTILVKRMEVEVAEELEVFCHIINHECAKVILCPTPKMLLFRGHGYHVFLQDQLCSFPCVNGFWCMCWVSFVQVNLYI
ncbi:hypothetical protein AXF42_Ash021021 [Apostasia shenzhenica]|uniref:Uncharacterized protein n=1 Tax=Apostasia shenzhenica TaxID=1088818 RepID=A0A2I0A566_9ASPA|nr:hypothetical protein AXF42_Ash021021 [Apostasia shenzhenica]